jgi:hypothetical protein
MHQSAAKRRLHDKEHDRTHEHRAKPVETMIEAVKAARRRWRRVRRIRPRVIVLALAIGVIACSALAATATASAADLTNVLDHVTGPSFPRVDLTSPDAAGRQRAIYNLSIPQATESGLNQDTATFVSDLSTADAQATDGTTIQNDETDDDWLDDCMKAALWDIGWDADWDALNGEPFSIQRELDNTGRRLVDCVAKNFHVDIWTGRSVGSYLLDTFQGYATEALQLDDTTTAFLDWSRVTAVNGFK